VDWPSPATDTDLLKPEQHVILKDPSIGGCPIITDEIGSADTLAGGQEG
jgi:hypothetical protein